MKKFRPAKRHGMRTTKKRTKHSLKVSRNENRNSHLRAAVRFDDLED